MDTWYEEGWWIFGWPNAAVAKAMVGFIINLDIR